MADYTWNEERWWITYGNDLPMFYGEYQPGNVLTTIAPTVETFISKVEWEARIDFLLDGPDAMEKQENDNVTNEVPLGTDGLPIHVDHALYTTKIEHLLYENKGFRAVENTNRRLY